MTAPTTETSPQPARPRASGPSSALRRAGEYGPAVLAAVALVTLALAGGGYGDVARHAAGVVVWLAVFGLLLVRGRAALPRGPVLWIAAAVGAFALLTGLSSLWSESAGRSYDELTRVLLYLGVFLAVAAAGSDARHRDQLLEGATLGMAVVLVVSVASRIEPGLFHYQDLQQFAPEFRPRLAYPFGYWNAVGSFAAIALTLLVHASSRADRSRAFRVAATALLPATGLALYLSFSRGAIVAATVAALIVLAFSPRRLSALGSLALAALTTGGLALLVRSYAQLNDGLLQDPAARSQGHRVVVALLLVSAAGCVARLLGERSTLPERAVAAIAPHRRRLAVGGALLAVLLAAAAAPRVADRVATFDDVTVGSGPATTNAQNRFTSASGNGRYQMWSSSWQAWRSRPVAGRGAGTWEFWWRRHATIDLPTRDSHSLFFDVLAELGTAGVVMLIAFLAAVARTCLTAARAARGDARAALVAVGAATVAWTLGALTDWTWEVPGVTVVLFALAAIAATALRDRRPATVAVRAGPARAGTVPVAGLALAAWAAVVLQAVGLISAWAIALSQGEVARSPARLGAAADDAELAHRVEPWAAGPYMQLALVQVRQASLIATPQAYRHPIASAREAVEREPTNWRTWLVLTRVEARGGALTAADRDRRQVERLTRGSLVVPTYQQLQDLATGKDLSLSAVNP